MKKYIRSIAVLFLVLSLAACGTSKETSSIASSISSESSSISSSATSETIPEEKEDNSIPAITVGQVVEIPDVCEFTIEDANIVTKVTPPSPASYYRYYEADAGKAYVNICIAYKNLSTSAVSSDDIMSGKAIYADKYEYSGFVVSEDENRSTFTYSKDISPLTTEYVHYLFEVPEEVQNASGEVRAEINIGGTEYSIFVRESESGTSSSVSTSNSGVQGGKQSGEVALNETVVTTNSEFSIESADISNKVTPPNLSGYYSYYEADSGMTYVNICFKYKNTSESDVMADEILSANLKYVGKYDYKGFPIVEEDNRGDFTYANITGIAPLTTEYIHYLFEVPQEVADSTESVVVSFVVDSNSYSYTVR